MHRRPRLSVVPVGAAVVALTLSGCSSTVEVSEADGASNPLCAKAGQHWPDRVAQQSQVKTSVDAATVRAWGDPAIIARCGVTSPGPTTEQCYGVDGVDWVARELSDGMSFVTYGRSPALEVLVPKKYSPEPLVLGAFTKTAQQIPQGSHRCSDTVN